MFLDNNAQIIKKAQFLVNKNFILTCDERNSMKYEKDNLVIDLCRESGTSLTNIYLRFKSFNNTEHSYNVGWMKIIFEKERNIDGTAAYQDDEQNIINLLDFLKSHYDIVMNEEFCKENEEKIHHYILEMHG